MEKIFGCTMALIMALMLGAGSTSYAACPEGYTDHVDATQYLTDFQLNTETGDLTFNDLYFPEEAFRRVYAVYLYEMRGECPFQVYGQEETTDYAYGGAANPIINNGTDLIDIGSWSSEVKGGVHTYNISKALDVCRKKGFAQGYLALRPKVYAKTGGVYGSEVSYYNNKNEDRSGSRKNLWQVNGFYFELESLSDASITVPETMRYDRDNQHYQVAFTCLNRCRYMVQYSSDNTNWQTSRDWIVEADEARQGVSVEASFKAKVLNVNKLWFRLIVENLETGKSITVNADHTVSMLYPLVQGSDITWHKKGEKVTITKLDECKELSFDSQLPVRVQATNDPKVVNITMPGCYVMAYQKVGEYTVKFLNADYTLLKTEKVPCGGDATAPANPTLGGYTFKGWDKDFTNVHNDLTVLATYSIGSDEYSLKATMTAHKNERYPYDRFANSETRAMVGDVLTFGINVSATASASLYYETGSWNKTEQKWIWSDGKKIGDYTAGSSQSYSQSVDVCWDTYNGVKALEHRFAVRFYLILGGNKLYTDPCELDVYYPITIASKSGNSLLVENQTGEFDMNYTITIPARNDDTIRVYNINGEGGGCFSYERVNKPQPQYAVVSGVDDEGNSFFLCPGEIETINTSAAQYAVVFDGATPTQTYDFTSQGLGKYTNVFYAEAVTCGESVQHMPEEPVREGYFFKGWTAWDSSIADDAYLKVPAVNDVYIGFSADWEEIPAGEKFIVRFFKKDGTTQIGASQLVNKGENATPPEAPDEAGFHFVGWDKNYTTVTANLDIFALYGDDSKTWTVAYYDEEGKTKLSEEVVADMMPANGLSLYKEGNEFVGWKNMETDQMEDLTHVSKNLNVKAVFQVKQAIDQVENRQPSSACRKVLRNGQLLIRTPNGTFDVMGRRVE